MQNENDDIEGLFRRASESYPLKSSGANWDKVAAMLDNQRPDNTSFIKRNLKRMLLPLIILLAISCYCVYFFTFKEESTFAIQKESKLIPKINSVQGVNDDIKNKSGLVENSHEIKKGKDYNDKEELANNNDKLTPQLEESLNRINQVAVRNSKLNVLGIKNQEYIKKNLKEHSRERLKSDIITPAIEDNTASNSLGTKKDTKSLSDPSIDNKQLVIKIDSIPSNIRNVDSTNIDKASSIQTLEKSKNKKVKKGTPSKYFYSSLIAGPDISNIRQQSYNKAGYSVGVLVGYNYNKLSIETGILWDKKYYSSDAKYFNPKVKYTSTYGMLTDVTGSCNMFEIPINFAVKINNDHSNSLLFKIGVSSYLMKNEDYKFSYINYGTYNQASASFKNSTNNFLSILNIGLSYERKISKNKSVGMEPYFKTPINNIGIGRMPISSSGLLIKLTQKF